MVLSAYGFNPFFERGSMARIARSDHPKILQAVDVKGRKVGDVAAEYGCTPANIYAILTRLRREGVAAPEPSAPDEIVVAAAPPKPVAKPGKAKAAPKAATKAAAQDLFAESPTPAPKSAGSAKKGSPAQAKSPVKSPVPVAPPAPVTKVAAGRAGGVGAKTAKPGFGLLIRTEDGEDALTPFRSLEDLLSAVKPILRTAARSPETIWFTIQPVDLATIEIDAE
jgi:hypothetical protein